jgi:hypothetical protein
MALSDILAAAEHGAALVYHEIVAIQADATNWTTDHPEVKPLISAGTNYAVQALIASGLPLPMIVTGGMAVLSALKAMAAADPTVRSGASSAAPVVSGAGRQ